MTTFIELVKRMKTLIKPGQSMVINMDDLMKQPLPKDEKKYTSSYHPITDHVYFDGHTFRVRFIKEGVKYSKNFKTRKSALKYKKKHVK